jgi:DNA polymerase-3 subunit epsilon
VIRRCVIVDTETTGLDPKTNEIIEVGAILYSVEHRTSLISFSTLQYAAENAAENINGISAASLADIEQRYPLNLGTIIDPLLADAEVIVAHHAEFDRQWFAGAWHAKPWLCTAFDFHWPKQTRDGSGLVSLALAHGIGVGSAHRALADCQMIASLFDRMHFFGADLQQMFARAMRPKATFQALVSFEQKDLAKDAGFKWDGATKKWTRRMAIEDTAALTFKVLELKSEVAA